MAMDDGLKTGAYGSLGGMVAGGAAGGGMQALNGGDIGDGVVAGALLGGAGGGLGGFGAGAGITTARGIAEALSHLGRRGSGQDLMFAAMEAMRRQDNDALRQIMQEAISGGHESVAKNIATYLQSVSRR